MVPYGIPLSYYWSISFSMLSCSFIGRLFHHALEDSRPKSVLVNSLSIFISLLDHKRLTLGTYYMFNRQLAHGSTVTANPETVEGMLSSLGEYWVNRFSILWWYRIRAWSVYVSNLFPFYDWRHLILMLYNSDRKSVV